MATPTQGQLWDLIQRIRSDTATDVDMVILTRAARDDSLMAQVSDVISILGWIDC